MTICLGKKRSARVATNKQQFTCRCVKPGIKTYVIDCEVVAYDREKDKILPFQVGLTLPALEDSNITP